MRFQAPLLAAFEQLERESQKIRCHEQLRKPTLALMKIHKKKHTRAMFGTITDNRWFMGTRCHQETPVERSMYYM